MNNRCLFWHRWSPWFQFKMTVNLDPQHDSTKTRPSFTSEELWQERSCLVCRKYQREKVKLESFAVGYYERVKP